MTADPPQRFAITELTLGPSYLSIDKPLEVTWRLEVDDPGRRRRLVGCVIIGPSGRQVASVWPLAAPTARERAIEARVTLPESAPGTHRFRFWLIDDSQRKSNTIEGEVWVRA